MAAALAAGLRALLLLLAVCLGRLAWPGGAGQAMMPWLEVAQTMGALGGVLIAAIAALAVTAGLGYAHALEAAIARYWLVSERRREFGWFRRCVAVVLAVSAAAMVSLGIVQYRALWSGIAEAWYGAAAAVAIAVIGARTRRLRPVLGLLAGLLAGFAIIPLREGIHWLWFPAALVAAGVFVADGRGALALATPPAGVDPGEIDLADDLGAG